MHMNAHRVNLMIAFGVASFFLLNTTTYSQRIVSFGIHVSPGYSSVSAKAADGLTGTTSKGSMSINFGITGQYFMDKSYGISSGIQLLNFKQTFSGKTYYDSFNSIDSEGESYERRVWGNDVKETSTLRLINIPIHFFYGLPIARGVTLYGAIGPGFSFPVQKQYTGSGVFTYKGYYPQYSNVIIENPSIYGFGGNDTIKANETLKCPFAIIDLGVSVGLSFTINRYYKFFTSVNYIKSVTGISKSSGAYHISNEMNSFYSLLYNQKNGFTNYSISFGITKDILY